MALDLWRRCGRHIPRRAVHDDPALRENHVDPPPDGYPGGDQPPTIRGRLGLPSAVDEAGPLH